MKELIIPPIASKDPDSFEILRVWAAEGDQHVTIHSNLNGGASGFGQMIADLALHGSKLYSQKLNQSEEKILKLILKGFREELKERTNEITGNIPD